MTPKAERQSLSVSSYVRRKPIDPNAEARERIHAKLREEVAIEEMVRVIERAVEKECEEGRLQ